MLTDDCSDRTRKRDGLAAIYLVWNGTFMAQHARRFLQVQNYRIPVPRGYTHFGDNMLYRFSFGAPFFRDAYGNIGTFAGDRVPDLPYDKLENGMVSAAKAESYRLQGRKIVQSEIGTLYCFHFTNPSKPKVVAVRCVVGSGELHVLYEGDARFSEDIFRVVGGITARK
jgi:hypothetical protein